MQAEALAPCSRTANRSKRELNRSPAFVTSETLHVDGGAHAGHW
jgi:hypothetical protein